jgi:glutamyl-tRNA reductase
MAGSIVSKLLHQPSARLRQAVADGGAGEALLSAAALIFDVPADGKPRARLA